MIILRIPKQSFSEGDFLFLEFRFSLFYRLIIQIYVISSRRFVQNFNLEAACLLYQWLNAYRMYTFFMYVGNDRRFPFSLALSISHLDHFRGISSRRSPSISPLLVNEKVVDHFFEIDDKKRRERGGKKRSGESISGLKTRSFVLSRNPFRYYQHQFFESVGAQFDASISAGKKSGGSIFPPVFQIRCPVSPSWRGEKKNDAQVVQLIFSSWISYSLERWNWIF